MNLPKFEVAVAENDILDALAQAKQVVFGGRQIVVCGRVAEFSHLK